MGRLRFQLGGVLAEEQRLVRKMEYQRQLLQEHRVKAEAMALNYFLAPYYTSNRGPPSLEPNDLKP